MLFRSLMSSGPRAGLAEIKLPERQAGSSIMPGKVNPVIPEAVNQAAFHVMAADLAVTLAAQAGQLELNAFLPLVAHHLLGSLEIMTKCVKMFTDFCIAGIEAKVEDCREMLDESLAAVTALVPHIGYEAATQVARIAYSSGRSIREVVIDLNLLGERELDIVLNPREMTRPGIAGEKALKQME